MRNATLILIVVASAVFAADEWPCLRGPTLQGYSDAKDLPVTWSEKENIKWKTELPGTAWSSPVVSGNEIWMTNSTDDGKVLSVICVTLDTGKKIHDEEVFYVEKQEFKHTLNSYASPSPIIDNGRLYVFFGTHGAACFDTKTAKKVWENAELKHDPQNQAGSSPVQYKDKILICIDGMDVQYQVALNKSDGKIAWKTERSMKFPPNLKEDFKKSYGTPLVYQVDGQDQMVAIAAEGFYAYDPNNGKELWRLRHPGFSCVAIPVYGNGLLYMSTGFTKPQMWAVKPIAGGGSTLDLPQENIVWKINGQTPWLNPPSAAENKPVGAPSPNKPSPVLIGNRLYMLADSGKLSCIDALSGKAVWVQALGGEYSASPTYADGKIYFFNHTGVGTVIEPGEKFKKLAENTLEEGCMASPAIVGKALIVRTKKAIYRIEK
ncbi:MAG TPA: PQQ-binding-like beta-propeller repeat protein [Planctomycetota bacterium]|nr:PQQ-binding-like beta-propeller repeat protein [Planctomycetota bacterium]